MAADSYPPLGDVSCRATGYSIQQLRRMGLPTAHLTQGLAYTLDELQNRSASIPWDDYLVFLKNSHTDLPTDQLVELCTSYKGSAYFRPLLSASGLWFHPAKYFRWVADPESGAIRQLFRCVNTRFAQVSDREVIVEEVIEPGFALPPDIFWETQSIAFGALTTHFGLGPSIVTWEPIERGAAFRVRLPRRRPVRFALSWLASWFRRDTAEDIRSAMSFGHERSLRLEREIALRKTAEAACQESEERFRRISDAVPGVVYQDYLDPDGRHGFVYVSGGATALTGYTPEELIARPELIWEGIDPDDVPRVQHSILASARTGTPWQLEFRFRTKAGDSRWVRGRSMPEPVNGSGRIVWNGILTDVTAERRAEAEFRSRDALLQKLSEQVPGFIYQYQQWPDGRSCFPYASEGIRDIYEVTPDEVRGSAATVFARLHSDDLDAVAESIRRSLETLEPWGCEYRVVLPTRGLRWLDGHAAPERMPDGSTIWHGYIRDVTDRKLAEDAIRESENRFRTLIQDLDVGVVLLSPDDRIVLSNSTACRILGLTHDQLHGVAAKDPLLEIVREDGTRFSPEDIPFSVVARTRQPLLNVTVGSRNQDTGHRTWMQVNGTPRLNPDGSLLHVILTFVDITERKRVEEALLASKTRFRAFMEFSPVLAWVVTPDGRFLFANHGFAHLLKMTPDAVERSTIHDIFPPEYAAEYLANNRQVLESVAPIETIEHATRADGSEGEFLAYKFPVPTPDGSQQIGGIAIDITDRRLAEDALRESEERLRLALAAGRMGTFDWDLTTDRVVWSDTHYELLGYPPGDRFPVEFRHFADRLHPEDRPVIERAIREAIVARRPYSNERRIVLPDGTVRWMLGSGEARYDPDGRPVRMLGTTIDITERKRAEAALRVSEERLSAVIDHAPNVAIQWYDSDGRVRLWNQASELMFGFPAGEAIGRTLDQLIHTQEEFALFRNTLAEITRTGRPSDPGEYTFRRRDGSTGVCLSTLFGIPGDASGDWFVCMDVDITERKRAETALRESELRYRTLIETSSDAIFVMDLTGRILSANPAAVRMHGYSIEELLSMRIQDLDLPNDAADLPDRMRRLRAGESLTFEVAHRRKDGTTFAVEVLASAVEIGTEWLVLAFDRDITERKQAEVAIRESEARLRVALSAAAAIAFVWDAATDSVVRYFSTEPALPTNPHAPEPAAAVRAKVHPDDRELFDAGVAACLADGSEYHNLYRVVRPDGTTRWLEEWGTLDRDRTNRPMRLTGISIDVTERKAAETELQEAEYRQRLALDAGRMGTWDWDIEHGRVTWDARQQELFGFAPGEYDGHPDTFFSRVHPDDVEMLRQRVDESVKMGGDYEAEFRIRQRPDQVRWVAGRGRLIRDFTGRPIRMVGVNFDQTDRKHAILALEEAERRQQLALDAGRMGTWDWEIGSDRLTWDDRERLVFGFRADEFDGRLDTFLNRIHPDDLAGVRQVLTGAAAGKDFEGEFRIRLASGEVRWIHGSGVTVPKDDHHPPRLVGINYDITERKFAEQALIEEKSLLQGVFGSLPGIAFAFDHTGRFVRWNHNYRTLLGWSDAEMESLTALDTVSPKDRARVAGVIREVFVLGESTTELHALGKDGQEIPLYCTGVRVSLGGEPCVVGYGIDISARVKAEEHVRASLREKEAMLKEIHHRVKNNLQVISSLLSLQATRVTHPSATDVLTESQNRVRAMALVHETLYRSDDLARVDLSRYLGELCSFLFRSFGVDSTRVRLDIDVESVTIALDKTIPCGLVVNEIVSNSLKYAFPGTRSGTVTVRARTRPDGQLTLTLADDGIGLPADLVLDHTPSLGLQLVTILAEQLGGQLTVERSPGTRFVFSFTP